ncbi:MAG: hypothetical protein M1823_005924 [Watsoniomyces obsoletus]|nr:MAG: hypothetical protein M1823_005924 [Watsoniomyces obsoletus]
MPKSPRFSSMVRDSGDSGDSLRPPLTYQSPRPTSSVFEPIDPSPITSDKTDIEDSAEEEAEPDSQSASEVQSPASKQSDKPMIDTSVVARPRSSSSETPQSVIHAPEGFRELGSESGRAEEVGETAMDRRKTPSPFGANTHRESQGQAEESEAQKPGPCPASPPPISTSVQSANYSIEDATPRAHTRQEVEAFSEKSWRQRASNLEDIPEALDPETGTEEESEADDDDGTTLPRNRRSIIQSSEEEITALKAALTECWTLCNTLAGLSSIHRQRIFHFSGSAGGSDSQQEQQAWRSCWKLCQKLYESRDEEHEIHVTPILDLCREFCQSLFDVRQRANDVTDSVLRVSFELNNHLYNSHDRNLPEVFRERTLDFYITLCHRLMKQRTRLAEETDSLLRTCWSLAEMLFSLRQNRREGKPADEELLGSAVQACWDLCDLFREGWTQIRPDRATPRPTQTTFGGGGHGGGAGGANSNSIIKQHNLDTVDESERGRVEPETPTTIFEDMALSPDGDDVNYQPPNILVLGTDNSQVPQQVMVPGHGGGGIGGGGGQNQRWSSSASSTALSEYSQSQQSQSSVGTSSTVKTGTTHGAGVATGVAPNTTSTTTTTTATISEDNHLNRLKILILKAAMNSGFQINSSGSNSKNQTLYAWGKHHLGRSSFGNAPWQLDLLENYQHMILTDSAFRTPVNLPPRRVYAHDMARSVEWMVRSGQYTFLEDLFRLVFGFTVHEAEGRSHVLIQT